MWSVLTNKKAPGHHYDLHGQTVTDIIKVPTPDLASSSSQKSSVTSLNIEDDENKNKQTNNK